MTARRLRSWSFALAAGTFAASAAFFSPTVQAQAPAAPLPAEVTFTKHIAPILQRSCENCHRTGGVAPMALQTYEQARPWARSHQGPHRHRPEAPA